MGYALSMVTEALIFIAAINVEATTLISMSGQAPPHGKRAAYRDGAQQIRQAVLRIRELRVQVLQPRLAGCLRLAAGAKGVDTPHHAGGQARCIVQRPPEPLRIVDLREEPDARPARWNLVRRPTRRRRRAVEQSQRGRDEDVAQRLLARVLHRVAHERGID